MVGPKLNVFYRTNEHENNKYVTNYSVYKIFNNKLDLTLPAKLVAEKYKQEPVRVIEAKTEKKYNAKKAEEILKEANKQGGLTR